MTMICIWIRWPIGLHIGLPLIPILPIMFLIQFTCIFLFNLVIKYLNLRNIDILVTQPFLKHLFFRIHLSLELGHGRVI